MTDRYLDSDDASPHARRRRAKLRGGAAQRLTTIACDGCWCGEPNGHLWPGKAQGAPHPREERTMQDAKRHILDEEDRIDIRLLRKFDRSVAKMIVELVNTYRVRYRIQADGVHVLLYPPGDYNPSERGARHKVASSRGSVQALESLEKWCQSYVAPALVNTQAEILAARFNDPAKVRRLKAAERPSEPAAAPVAQSPRPGPLVAQAPASQAEQPGTDSPPPGYEVYWGNKSHRRAEPLNWWKKIGEDQWLCKSCDYTATQVTAHQKKHTSDARKAELTERAAVVATSGSVPMPGSEDPGSRQVKAARTRKIRKAVRMISEATGVDLADTATLERRIARLTSDLAKVSAERDDALARIALIKEGLRA